MARFLPSVMVTSVLNKLDLSYPEIEKDLPKYINSGLMVLYKRQHDDNGWGWYENDETTAYMTAYVLYGLIEAEKILPGTNINIRVDKDVIRRGTASLISQLPQIEKDSEKVYALYVLSHTDRLKLEWLDEMFEKRDKLTAISKAMLLISYENMGVDNKAKTLYDMLMAERIEENGYVHWGYKGEDFYWWQWEADELETTSYALRVMARRDLDNPLIAKAIRWLIVNRTGNYWRSTKASGKIIYAFSDYLSRTEEMNPNYELTLKLNGTDLKKLRVTKKNLLDGFGAITIKDKDIKQGENVIEISKKGPGTLYYSTTFTYYVDRGDIAPDNSGFKVERRYYLLEKVPQDGKLIYLKKPLNGPVRSGDEILVELDVSGDKVCDYLLLEDYFPSGCEVIVDDENYTITGDDFYSGRYIYWYAGREIRDERIAYSLRNFRYEKYTFKYLLRAQIPGMFEVMPAKAYLMYYPTLTGRTGSGELVINESR
ncbi:MAG: hypothetical protein JW984_11105 [Deltaproteobacteria bacterium]|uniref:Bacterial alpha-2-macroglobulin MG10 domain-containing protein n=1 Tax=Candidatus Zymogenus saltonus TaxID=2844893 RepID=A0A9D8KGG5_9DELT|nr:hypothetical protein [Candidatus Zymogenus saltonus]